MGRPRKGDGLVGEQFHVGVRFEAPVRAGLLAVMAAENERRMTRGELPNVTASALVKRWVMDRLRNEFDTVLVDENHIVARMEAAGSLDVDDVRLALMSAEDERPAVKMLAATSTKPKKGARR